ncbi:MAG: TraR/DksA family transcriptional regulator, partial [Sediminibacterium sp.]
KKVAAPVKKAAPVKAVAPAKKVAAPVKKAAPVKSVPAKVAAPVKKAAPAPKAPAPKPAAKPAAPVKAAKPAKVAAVKAPPAKVIVKTAPVRPGGKVVLPSKPVPKIAPPPPVVKAKLAPLPPMPKKPEVKLPPAPPKKPVRKPLEPIKDVKLPKTNTKSSVPYSPGYTPLEKRVQIVTKSNQTLVKYSDTELNEFRELINKKLEAAKKELVYLQGLITRKDEMGGDNDDARYMTMEDGSVSMEREQLSQMASRQITYIDHLEKAIMRIESKTYGICRVTGKLIDKARLRAVPHATLSLEAKLGLVKPSPDQQ